MLSRKLMFVVESVADQQAASTPLSDCRSRYVQSFGHLFLCEFAHLTKPIVAALQMIRTSQLGHDAPVEGQSFARTQATSVEFFRRLAIGMTIQEMVDLLDDFWGGLPTLPRVARS